MQNPIHNRNFFVADNLEVLRNMDSNSFDLIYLDPPFNKNRSFTKPIDNSGQKVGFEDIFREGSVKAEWLCQIADTHPKTFSYIHAIGDIGPKTNKNYLCFMAIRLIECHRILKDTGSLYLHCDDTMSSHLRLLLDCIFGEKNFRNQITWKRVRNPADRKKALRRVHDFIFFYSKTAHFLFNSTYKTNEMYSEEELNALYPHTEEETGRRYKTAPLELRYGARSIGEKRTIQGKTLTTQVGWRWTQKTFDKRIKENPHLIYWTQTGRPRYKVYADRLRPTDTIWDDCVLGSGDAERTGYMTQKPIKLLQRIILASSKKGDWVLDPFCGSGTTCVAAETLGRKWVGIDQNPMTYQWLQQRLKHTNQPIILKRLAHAEDH